MLTVKSSKKIPFADQVQLLDIPVLTFRKSTFLANFEKEK